MEKYYYTVYDFLIWLSQQIGTLIVISCFQSFEQWEDSQSKECTNSSFSFIYECELTSMYKKIIWSLKEIF